MFHELNAQELLLDIRRGQAALQAAHERSQVVSRDADMHAIREDMQVRKTDLSELRYIESVQGTPEHCRRWPSPLLCTPCKGLCRAAALHENATGPGDSNFADGFLQAEMAEVNRAALLVKTRLDTLAADNAASLPVRCQTLW